MVEQPLEDEEEEAEEQHPQEQVVVVDDQEVEEEGKLGVDLHLLLRRYLSSESL